ncbi:hypothetical protein [uncultured Flavonifractor sp.]|uniref:hypothetical protein n=1 Tax=uncultured Flavonifractor sp. TaxID=1193534 RepID=UPI00260DDDE5|nr:hypothetical protein [uncultured Flavonifractor sp.]
MPTSKAQQRAVNKYVANNYDRVLVTMPKGQKDIIKTHAEARGESVNAFINRAIAQAMERDKRPQEAPAVQDNTQAQERTEGVPLHTLEQRIRKKLYKYGATIRKNRKSGGYTVVYEDTTLDFPDYAALLEYAQGLDKD